MTVLQLVNSPNFNICTFIEISQTEEDSIQIARDLELIPAENWVPACQRCGNFMRQELKPSYKLGYRFTCNRCRLRISPLKGTFFERTHLSIKEALRLMVSWFFRLPMTQAALHCEVSKKIAIEFYVACREVCRVVHSHDEVQIGGAGDVVEVDETKIFRPKFNRGRRLKRPWWVFGGVSRLTKKQFMVPVRRTNRTTLYPLMQNHIAQDTYIFTDEAAVYGGCEVLGFAGHFAVSHARSFVRRLPAFLPNGDPRLGRVLGGVTRVKVHTNSLECRWGILKHLYLRRCRSVALIPNYIGEYLYRTNILSEVSNHRRNMGRRFQIYIRDMRRVFPGPLQTPISADDCACDECIG